jgi:ATP/maltotriose-dependent transcriptional regulator MalT
VEHLTGPNNEAGACILIAPAGFGKTTLLAQVASRALQAGRCVGWLSLTAAHAHPERLLEAIYESLGLNPAAQGPSFAALAQQLDALDSATLFLDQLEALIDTPALTNLGQLIEGLHHCRVFIAGRASGHLKLSRLALAGRVRLIGTRELAFSPAEVHGLFEDLNLEQATAIVKETAGWAVAVCATVRSRGASPAPQEPEVPIMLGRYIEENLLATETPESLALLMEAAVFDRLSAALLSETPLRAYACVDLAQWAERNIPIEAIDSQPGWYRLNPLFQAALRQRLRHLDPARFGQLHR